MSDDPPIIVIGIALILVAVAVIALRSRGKLKQLIIRNKKSFFSLFVVGLVLALTAALFMFDGDMLGENTTGIATVVGIVGIGLIAISNFTLLKR
jgi:multisubunit Na+/H+ antiporter MnhB subunit